MAKSKADLVLGWEEGRGGDESGMSVHMCVNEKGKVCVCVCRKVTSKKMATEYCRNKSRNGFIITYFSVRSNKFKHLTPRKAEVKQCCGIVYSFRTCYILCFCRTFVYLNVHTHI